MKEVTFTAFQTIGGHMYTSDVEGDMSGPYVPAAVARQLLEALKVAEFSRKNHYFEDTCPVCLMKKYDGHLDDCIVGQAIAAAKGA